MRRFRIEIRISSFFCINALEFLNFLNKDMSRGRISSSNKIHKHDDYIIMKLHDCQENFRKLQVKFVSRKKSADNFEDDTRPSGRKFADK